MSNNAQFKACKRAAFAPKSRHEHHQKPRNAPARHLPDSRRNHPAVPHHHPDHSNGNPGAGSWDFDSYRQIAAPLFGPDLHRDSSRATDSLTPNFSGF